MLVRRPAADRGVTDLGWLVSRHSFSFGSYDDPRHMGFRSLRVINDDRVRAGAGFGRHPHRDMEIFSYILEGRLSHEDSLGTGSTVEAGGVQKMSAGTGILHSEFNPSKTEPLRFLQVWIIPETRRIPPSYDQKVYADGDKRDRLTLIGSKDGRDGSIAFQQDVAIFASILSPDRTIEYRAAAGRGLWLQIARGAVTANGTRLDEGDGLALENEGALTIRAVSEAEFLLFDLA